MLIGNSVKIERIWILNNHKQAWADFAAWTKKRKLAIVDLLLIEYVKQKIKNNIKERMWFGQRSQTRTRQGQTNESNPSLPAHCGDKDFQHLFI